MKKNNIISKFYYILERILFMWSLKGLCLIRVMSNFDFLDPGRYTTLKMMHFLLLQKLASVPLKSRFRLAIIIPGKCKYILF